MKHHPLTRHNKTVHKVVTFVAVLAGGGLAYLSLSSLGSSSPFSTIAFIISVAALVMTVLQSLTIERQMHITQQSASIVHEASSQIEALIREDRKIEHEIMEDLKIDHKIIGILEEYGVGANDLERQAVAGRIAETLSPKTNVK